MLSLFIYLFIKFFLSVVNGNAIFLFEFSHSIVCVIYSFCDTVKTRCLYLSAIFVTECRIKYKGSVMPERQTAPNKHNLALKILITRSL
jgi:hypothetical protein